jgi:hypothetical protein
MIAAGGCDVDRSERATADQFFKLLAVHGFQVRSLSDPPRGVRRFECVHENSVIPYWWHWWRIRVDVDKSFFDESIDSLLDPIPEFDALFFVELWIKEKKSKVRVHETNCLVEVISIHVKHQLSN